MTTIKKRAELRDIFVNRVSLVKRPANARPFLLLKAEDEEQEEISMYQPSAFEKAVEERARAIIQKGDDKRTPERIRADITYELAAEQPDLYTAHRERRD